MGGAALSNLVTAATVRARVTADSWEDAVGAAGEVLVRADICTPAYVDAMRDTVRELGPYAVVAPGVAIPHARPEQGVLRPGIAVLTLAPPVEFGSTANDPVDLVIPFAAVDKDAHMDTLKRIVDLLRDETALARVRAAASDQELLAALGAGTPTDEHTPDTGGA